MSLPVDDKDHATNFFKASIERTPIYFAVSMLCFSFLAVAYWGMAPVWLLTAVPIIVFTPCALRIVVWLRFKIPEDQDELNSRLRQFAVESLSCIALLSMWPMLIVQYADPFRHLLTAANFAMVTLVCIYCMMHMRAAILVSLLVSPASVLYLLTGLPFAIRFGFSGIFLSVLGCTSYMIRTYAATFDVLSEQKNALEKLSRQNFLIANSDPLTGLPNRRRFFADLGNIGSHELGEHGMVIAIIDLDGFKPINDLYGHAAGDRALEVASERMVRICDGLGAVYRLGGDEFAILIARPGDDKSLMSLAGDLIASVGSPFVLGGNQLAVGASIGFARYPNLCDNFETLFECADYALYHSKRNGRGRATIFNKDHERAIRNSSVVEYHLKNADLAREFSVVYQPMVDSRSGEVLAAECLARWISPALGTVPPSQFIPAIERIGMIDSFTTALFGRALADMATWPPHMRLSFNLSAYDICADGRAERLIEMVREAGIDIHRIEFELTETGVMHNFEAACHNMEVLRSAGARLSLDDFGTGYSSLSHLNRLPLDKLKIDKSFVHEIEAKGSSYAIVQSVTLLSRELGFDCVAEGVENARQVAALAMLGCFVLQGYYFSEPLTALELSQFLARQIATPAIRRAKLTVT